MPCHAVDSHGRRRAACGDPAHVAACAKREQCPFDSRGELVRRERGFRNTAGARAGGEVRDTDCAHGSGQAGHAVSACAGREGRDTDGAVGSEETRRAVAGAGRRCKVRKAATAWVRRETGDADSTDGADKADSAVNTVSSDQSGHVAIAAGAGMPAGQDQGRRQWSAELQVSRAGEHSRRHFIASYTAWVQAPVGVLVMTGSEPPVSSVATVRS
jgi:hypothetical protein